MSVNFAGIAGGHSISGVFSYDSGAVVSSSQINLLSFSATEDGVTAVADGLKMMSVVNNPAFFGNLQRDFYEIIGTFSNFVVGGTRFDRVGFSLFQLTAGGAE